MKLGREGRRRKKTVKRREMKEDGGKGIKKGLNEGEKRGIEREKEETKKKERREIRRRNKENEGSEK